MRINDSKITNNANSCTIVGAGLIGLEMAEAFKKRGRESGVTTGSSDSGINVTVVEMADHILPNLLLLLEIFVSSYFNGSYGYCHV